MTIVALDLASQTGWAVARPPYRCAPTPLEHAATGHSEMHGHGTIKIDNNQREPLGKFLVAYEIWFRRNIFEVHRPRGIIYESAFSTHHQNSSRLLLSLGAVIEQLAYRHRVPYVRSYRPQDIKIHATGKGNATKDAMYDAARAVGWAPKSFDEADALWLLDYAIAKLAPGELEADNDIGPSPAPYRQAETARRTAVV